jgi:hypothetical protein
MERADKAKAVVTEIEPKGGKAIALQIKQGI